MKNFRHWKSYEKPPRRLFFPLPPQSQTLLTDAPIPPQSLRWLFHNYFMPELHPSSAEPARCRPLRSAAPLLKKYSVLMKVVTRDVSLRQKHQPEIDGILRDLERWIAEAKTAVDISSGNLGWEDARWDDPTVTSTQAVKERLALEALCENLMEKGALVPLAKKRVVSSVLGARVSS